MSSLSGLSSFKSSERFVTQFQFYLGKVVNDKTTNMAASVGLAVLTSLSSNYVTGLLAGSVVYLLAENYRIAADSEQRIGRNIELTIKNVAVSTLLDLCQSKDAVPKLQAQVQSMQDELRGVTATLGDKQALLQVLEGKITSLAQELQTARSELKSSLEEKGTTVLELQGKIHSLEGKLEHANEALVSVAAEQDSYLKKLLSDIESLTLELQEKTEVLKERPTVSRCLDELTKNLRVKLAIRAPKLTT